MGKRNLAQLGAKDINETETQHICSQVAYTLDGDSHKEVISNLCK